MPVRKRVLLCLLALCLLAVPLLASAEEAYSLFIEDGAELFTSQEEQLLLQTMADLLPYGNVALLSTDSNDSTPEHFAQSRFLQHFGDTSGMVLLIDMDNRYIYLAANGSAKKYLTNARCDAITDNVYSYATKGYYYLCAEKAFSQAATALEGGVVASPLRYAANLLLAVCLALAVNFFLVSRQHRKIAPENALNVKVAVNAGEAAVKAGAVAAVAMTMLRQQKTRHVESSGGSGGHSGGGFSGGGHSGGGFSGGGHRF